jgi:hypothetical protein
MNSFFNPADKLSERRPQRVEILSVPFTRQHGADEAYILCIDYDERDLAKKHKCKFDMVYKRWYCEDKKNPLILTHTRVDLDIKFNDKDEFKALGAKFDPIKKVWYGKSGNIELMEAYEEYLN